MKRFFLRMIKRVGAFLLISFVEGIAILIPILIALWLFGFVWGGETVNLKEILRTLLEKIPGITVKEWMIGLSLLVLILLIGVLSTPIFKRLYNWIGSLIRYLMWKKIKKQGQMVVVFEYFRENLWALGIVTGFLKKSEHLKRGRVLKIISPSVPVLFTAPALLFLQEKEVISTKLPVDEIVNSFVSGGFLAPHEIPELVRELERRELSLSEKDKQKILKAVK